MRASFARYRHAAPSGLAQQGNTARSAQVLAMNARPNGFSQQDIAGHNHLLACGGPASQTQRRAPIAFVHDAVRHEGIILAMVHHREVAHFGVLKRPAHEFVILHTMAIIGDRYYAGFLQRPNRGQFLAFNAFRNCTGYIDIYQALRFHQFID